MKSIAKTKAEIQREYEKRTGYQAKKKYESANVTRLNLALNNKTDADILQKLQEVPNKQGYIKSCIRENISKEK